MRVVVLAPPHQPVDLKAVLPPQLQFGPSPTFNSDPPTFALISLVPQPVLSACSATSSLASKGGETLEHQEKEKMSTIVMRVDLDCDRCYKKIRKVLCKLQDRENIKMISYDEKSNMVTVSGSFDAEEVSDRLCSGAGKVITDIQVARGNQMMPGAGKAAPKHPGKESHGHGGQQGHGHGGGGGGGKQDKTRHVKFDMDDEEIDQHAHQGKGHGNKSHAEKPRVFTTTAMSRNEAPRPQQAASMAAMAPMRMPTPGPSMTMMPQAMSAPSIWPAPPAEPAYGYGGGPPAGGYYGGPVYDHGGYGAYGGGGYGRNPYQPQYYYEEEPSAGCSVM